MRISVSKIFTRVGVDAAIAYTVLSRIIQAGGGVLLIVFIAKYLSKVEQGYYFTFGSILAIQIFFELGLSSIITQFVAHEVAHLKISEYHITGNEKAQSRLSSLLHFCVKWFSVISIVLLVILITAGFVFFTRYGVIDKTVKWEMPWLILSISTACSLTVSPILAFFEGLGKVKEVALVRLVQQSFQLIILFCLFSFGLRLFASPIASLTAFLIAPFWLFFYKRKLLISIWKKLGADLVNYKLEIFPFQWKIALSWISGYFIFQLFNPVLFATDGPVVAGQMGMTLTALNGVLSIALSWINTKVPLFSNLISKSEYQELDSIFYKTVKQASMICAFFLIVFVSAVFFLQFNKFSTGNRFLPIIPLVLLATAAFVNQFVSALATYLRCHKQEPFLIQSLILGLLTAASTFVLGNLFGINGIVIGYTSLVVLVTLPWSLYIFFNKRKLWHQ